MDKMVESLQINLTGPAKAITTGSWDFAELPQPEVFSAREAELSLDPRFAKCGANSLRYRWHGAGNALRIDRAPELLAALKKYPGGISEEYITQFGSTPKRRCQGRCWRSVSAKRLTGHLTIFFGCR